MASLTVQATPRLVITATRLHIAAFISAADGAAVITTVVMAVTGVAMGTVADMAVTVANGPVARMGAAVGTEAVVVGIGKDGSA
ncbi:hypothetical protein [Caballeronia sordidicola]